MENDFTLTYDQVAEWSAAHGGYDRVMLHGNHTVELLDALGDPSGWNMIRRDPETGLCSRSDTLAALGY